MPTRFNTARLIRRTVAYHRRSYLLVLLAAAVATAIITGALLVGDSVRGSLAERVEQRLGAVDHAIIAAGWIRQELAAEIATAPELRGATEQAVAVIILKGSVMHADSGARASDVSIVGVPASFWGLWREPRGAPDELKSGWTGRQAIVNASLAAAIGAKGGDAVLVSARKDDGVPAEHALGRSTGDVQAIRLELSRVLADEGLALFEIHNGQASPRNVFVPLEALERALDKRGLANAVLVAGRATTEQIAAGFRRVWKLEDAGLKLTVRSELGYASIESRSLVLALSVVDAVSTAAKAAGAETQEVLTYLANGIVAGQREVPYSTITAVRSIGGVALEPGSILLNAWAAEDLQANVGDAVRVAYYAVGAEHRLEEKVASFTLRGVVAMNGEAADPGWTPEYPGISDAKGLRDWDPPFPVDLKRVRDKDEDYWKAHRTAPKAFVSLEDGQRLWTSRFGNLTSIRIRAPRGGPALVDLVKSFEARLIEGLSPAVAGLEVRAVKAEGLEAARGGTDFGMLFVSFSFFLIVSGLVLLSMVFRLVCERRARELGVFAAVGFSPRAIRRLLFLDGGVLAVGGAVLGVAGGLVYAALLIAGLRGWWKGAVNAPFLSLHPSWTSLVTGGASTAVLALLTIFFTVRKASKAMPRSLLIGRLAIEDDRSSAARRRAGKSAYVAGISAVLAGTMLTAGLVPGGLEPAAAFFGGGACLLIAALSLVHSFLRRGAHRMVRGRGALALARLGARNGGRAPGRSLLTAILIASASFIIVTVAASRRDPGSSAPRKESGDGGFALVGRASLPLTSSLRTREGREALNIAPATSALLDRAKVFTLRVKPGDDASCLNLYRPKTPRILGAPRDFIERGGFAWDAFLAQSDAERANPWLLLDGDLEDGAVPVVADANTATWILHSGLGKDLTVADDSGRETKLRIVGLLSHSIFQGELIVSERRFLSLFPGVAGNGYFLLESSAEDAGPLSVSLEKDLAERGFDAEPTGAILAAYQAVENTYLSTFEMLGGLGLLLGTLGLGAVLLRNVNERKAELALLRAVGFSRGAIAWLVLSETSFLLGMGLLAGAGAAFVAVAPSALRAHAPVSWSSLAATLAVILAAGLASSTIAVRAALRAPLIPALRGE